MSDVIHFFRNSSDGLIAVLLPFDLDRMIAGWSDLAKSMVRNRHEAFTRDEWAYIINFLDSRFLSEIYTETLGSQVRSNSSTVHRLMRPRGEVAVWLPNNVSLLGPLVLILVSLTGNPLMVKGGSRSHNLTQYFMEYARSRLGEGVLRDYLGSKVKVVSFSRDDRRQLEMAEQAKVRLIFGSDSSARSIEALPHPVDSIGFSFVDRRSEIWLEPSAIRDDTLSELIKILAIYGRSGCTSPQKVVVLGGSPQDAVALSKKLAAIWPSTIRRDVERHIASENIKCMQWAQALGWEPVIAERNGAVFAAGSFDLQAFTSGMTLPVLAGTVEEAITNLPANIQTIGYALVCPEDLKWLSILGNTRIKRFVPISRMHHFGPLWDGYCYWSSMFENVEIGC